MYLITIKFSNVSAIYGRHVEQLQSEGMLKFFRDFTLHIPIKTEPNPTLQKFTHANTVGDHTNNSTM